MEHLTRPELVESIIVQEKIKFELELKVITDADNADAYKKLIDAAEAKVTKCMEAFGDARNDVTPRVGAGDDTYASNVNQVGGAGTHVSVAKGNNGKSAVHAVVPQVKWKQKQHAKVNLGTTTQTCSGKATTQTCSGNATIQTCSGIATTQTCSGNAMNGDNADSYNENYVANDNVNNCIKTPIIDQCYNVNTESDIMYECTVVKNTSCNEDVALIKLKNHLAYMDKRQEVWNSLGYVYGVKDNVPSGDDNHKAGDGIENIIATTTKIEQSVSTSIITQTSSSGEHTQLVKEDDNDLADSTILYNVSPKTMEDHSKKSLTKAVTKTAKKLDEKFKTKIEQNFDIKLKKLPEEQAKEASLMALTTNDSLGVNENNFEEAEGKGLMADKRVNRPPEERDKVINVSQNEHFNYAWQKIFTLHFLCASSP